MQINRVNNENIAPVAGKNPGVSQPVLVDIFLRMVAAVSETGGNPQVRSVANEIRFGMGWWLSLRRVKSGEVSSALKIDLMNATPKEAASFFAAVMTTINVIRTPMSAALKYGVAELAALPIGDSIRTYMEKFRDSYAATTTPLLIAADKFEVLASLTMALDKYVALKKIPEGKMTEAQKYEQFVNRFEVAQKISDSCRVVFGKFGLSKFEMVCNAVTGLLGGIRLYYASYAPKEPSDEEKKFRELKDGCLLAIEKKMQESNPDTPAERLLEIWETTYCGILHANNEWDLQKLMQGEEIDAAVKMQESALQTMRQQLTLYRKDLAQTLQKATPKVAQVLQERLSTTDRKLGSLDSIRTLAVPERVKELEELSSWLAAVKTLPTKKS